MTGEFYLATVAGDRIRRWRNVDEAMAYVITYNASASAVGWKIRARLVWVDADGNVIQEGVSREA